MNTQSFGNKSRIALLASVGLNIFFGAFLLGQTTSQGIAPPPDNRLSAPLANKERFMGQPPMFGLGDLFNPRDMFSDKTRMREHFQKMEGLRKDFAELLMKGPISKETALKHFSDMNAVMEEVKEEAQNKAAERISLMQEDERQRLAQSLQDPSRRHKKFRDGKSFRNNGQRPQPEPPPDQN